MLLCSSSCLKEVASNKTLKFETEFIYSFENNKSLNPLRKKEFQSEILAVRSYKNDPTIDGVNSPDKYLAKHLSNCIEEGKLTVQLGDRQGTLKELGQLSYLEHYDTTITEHSFEMSMVITNSRVFEKWNYYKIKQTWCYNEETKMLEAVVDKITPLVKDRHGRHIGRFSIPAPQKSKKKEDTKAILNNENNIWVTETSNYLSFDDITLIEGDKAQLKEILWENVLSKKTKAYTKDYHGVLQDFDADNLLKERIDTVVSFDPISYDEMMAVRKNSPALFRDIEAYKVNQIWYFNNKELNLKTKLIKIEPLVLDSFENKLEGLYILKAD